MNPSEPVVLGVDVGATKILVGAVGRTGTVYAVRRYPMERATQETSLHSLRTAIATFYAEIALALAPRAIGIGVVGQTDPATATWVHAYNIPISRPVALGAELGARYGVGVALDNDVHAATMAELRLGLGRGARDFIYLNVGTGIAAGMVCNGQLVRGAANFAGEFGHMMVEPGGEPCVCGLSGCLEPLASGGGMIAQVRALLADYPTSSLRAVAEGGTLTSTRIFQAADAGDALATRVAARAERALGIALVNLINLLNPQAIALGGGVVSDGWLLPRLRAHVMSCALPGARIALQTFGLSPLPLEQVGLLGAATLAWETVKEELSR
jgi:glucokinase